MLCMFSTMDADKETHLTQLSYMWLSHLCYLECNSWSGIAVGKEVGNVKDRYENKAHIVKTHYTVILYDTKILHEI